MVSYGWPGSAPTLPAVTHTLELDRVRVKRSYKFRMRPTARQHVALQQCLDAHRELYNAALQERRDAWRIAGKRIRFLDQCSDLPYIRSIRPDIARWGAGSEQATLRRLDRSFQNFFRRCKAGEKPGYPRFKNEHRFRAMTWPRVTDACNWRPETSRVYLLGIGNVRVTMHRPVEGRVKTITAFKEGRHWYVVLSCEDVPTRPLASTGAVIGIDMGTVSFATTSDGEQISNPRHSRANSERLARANRVLSRTQKGSRNRRRAGETVGRLMGKERNRRLNFHHQVARRLIRDHDLIAIEKLLIKNMTRSARGTLAKPGIKVAARTGRNKAILDAGWYQFRKILTEKAEEAGRFVIPVNAQYTSQACHKCGHTAKANRITRAEFRCLNCGHTADADVNAAKNILRAGLALLDGLPSGEESVGLTVGGDVTTAHGDDDCVGRARDVRRS